jgi:hypothetical protein
MRAFFIGGTVDNSELDLGGTPPQHYPPDTGRGVARYSLHRAEERDGECLYAVYAAPGLGAAEVDRIFDERGYGRRFDR